MTRLSEVWATPTDARDWVVEVVGENIVTTCDTCRKDSIPGTGLLPKLHQEATTVTAELQNLVGGATPPTLANLDTITAPGVAITRQVIEAIRDMIPLAPLHNPANIVGIEAAMAKVERSAVEANLEREKAEKPERPEKAEKPEKPERPEKAEKPEKLILNEIKKNINLMAIFFFRPKCSATNTFPHHLVLTVPETAYLLDRMVPGTNDEVS